MKRIILATFIFSIAISSLAAAQVTVDIQPASQVIEFPDTAATFDIRISGVSDLYGFQLDVTNNTGTWSVNSIAEGGFLSNSGSEGYNCPAIQSFPGNLFTRYACTRSAEISGVSGTGSLLTVTLDAQTVAGTTNFGIANVKLADRNSQPISFNTVNGGSLTWQFCSNGATLPCGPGNETGICENGTKTCSDGLYGSCIGATYPTDETCDGQDQDCDGNVDDPWMGVLDDPCTVGIGECENSGVIECATTTSTGCSVSALPAGTESCPFTIEDEDCDGQIIEFRGDADCSCGVGLADFTLLGLNFGTSPPSDARADLNGDNEVDIFDLVMIGSNYGIDYSGAPYNEICS